MLSDDLVELQRLDTRHDQLVHRRARLPERAPAEAAGEALAASTSRQAAIGRRDDELNRAIEALERQGEEITAHQARLQAQLKTVIAPREAEALMHEIDALAARQDELDDEELGHLEEQSDLADEQTALVAAVPDLQHAADEAGATLAVAEAAVDAELTDTAARRGEVADRLGPAVVADYERRRSHYGGVAVARLDGKRCSGCSMDLSPAELDGLKAVPAGELTDCPQCGRLLAP